MKVQIYLRQFNHKKLLKIQLKNRYKSKSNIIKNKSMNKIKQLKNIKS